MHIARRIGWILMPAVVVLIVAALTISLPPTLQATNTSANPVTPGRVSGIQGFDQCEAPSQDKMDVWIKRSPYRAVGIYISGKLRFCQAQYNLTPTWVTNQLKAGWHLLPIHLGRQANCTSRDRYRKSGLLISTNPADGWAEAKRQARSEASQAVVRARELGIPPKSTIFYDLEGDFPMNNRVCKESILQFTHAWTERLHQYGYLSGFYSSAGKGIVILDEARRTRPEITLPDILWIARWDRQKNTSTTYISDEGWKGRRIKQYIGGHNETWGGVTINIDTNYLDLSQHGVSAPAKAPNPINRREYRFTGPNDNTHLIKPAQMLLKQQGLYTEKSDGKWDRPTADAVIAYRSKINRGVKPRMVPAVWMSLLTEGAQERELRGGTRNADVLRVQRALNAAGKVRIAMSGYYNAETRDAVKWYQKRVGLRPNGVVNQATWDKLRAGVR